MKKITKYQIIVALVGILAGVYLFTLPKGNIKKETAEKPSESANRDKPQQEKEQSNVASLHQTEMSSLEKNKIQELTKKYYSFYNSEKKITFADSLAFEYRKIHWYDSAMKYVEVLASEKKTPETFVRAGDYFFEAYSFSDNPDRNIWVEKSRAYYNNALKANAKDYDTKCKLAMTYVGGENPMQGIGILKGVLKEDPNNETAMYQLGVLSLQSGQYDKAIERFEELIRINPKSANAFYYLGVAFDNKGKTKEAIEALEKAKELETDKAFRAAVDDYLSELNK